MQQSECSGGSTFNCVIYIDGMHPTDVTAEQTSLSTVLIMWTASSPPPTDGYQVNTTSGSTTTAVNVAGTSYTLVNNQTEYGVYSIQVRSLSLHFQTNVATKPVHITMRGNRIRTCHHQKQYTKQLKPGSGHSLEARS